MIEVIHHKAGALKIGLNIGHHLGYGRTPTYQTSTRSSLARSTAVTCEIQKRIEKQSAIAQEFAREQNEDQQVISGLAKFIHSASPFVQLSRT